MANLSKKTKNKNERKTIRELGRMLPIGLKASEQFKFKPKDGSFKFKDWGFKEEEEIAKLKQDESSSGRFATRVLDLMLEELGGLKWSEMDETRLLVLNQACLSDMMYMYIHLRIDSMGHEFAFSHLTCPFCGHDHEEYVVDLRDLDVDCSPKDDPVDSTIDYKLLKPFSWEHNSKAGKVEEKIESLKIRRSPWQVMEEITGETAQNEGLTKRVIIKGSLQGYNDTEGYVDDEKIIGRLQKADYERIDRVIARHNAGPTISVSDKCESCGKKWAQQINWSYDYFLASSSLPSV